MGMIQMRQALYLSLDGKRLVGVDDPDAGRLYCRPGDAVSEEELARLGWTRPDSKASLQAKAVEAAPENKALEMPVAKAKRARLVKK